MIILSIGSNLSSKYGDRFDNIKKCISLLNSSHIALEKASHFYETPSYPNNKFPKFINIVLIIKFNKDPNTLIKLTKLIEKKMGRIKAKKNAPRIIDIDIIDFNKLVIKDYLLTLPHPLLEKRNFVLFPLKEISPNWQHPISNKKIDFYIEKLDLNESNQITRINESATIGL